MGMRTLAVISIALCAGGCASVNVEPIGPGGYSLEVPTDTFSSRHAMQLYAAEAAGDLCPQGWQRLDVRDRPSDVAWTIKCAPGSPASEALLSSPSAVPAPETLSAPPEILQQSPPPAGVSAPPPVNMPLESPPGSASAPPQTLVPSQTEAPRTEDDAVPADKL
jgi:hypothetical protein